MIRHQRLRLLDPIGTGIALAETALAGHRVNQIKTLADIVRVDAVKGHAAQITGLAICGRAVREGAANRAVIIQTRLHVPGEQTAVIQVLAVQAADMLRAVRIRDGGRSRCSLLLTRPVCCRARITQ